MLEFKNSKDLVPYPEALASMEAQVTQIIEKQASEQVWFLEHPPLYTSGTSAKADDLLNAGDFPVFEAGRGGQFTYHGPGQRIAYVMLDLKARRRDDVRRYVADLEHWLIATLGRFGIKGMIREGRVGVWVETKQGEAKIAALGIRIRKWVTFHGIALNVHPDLNHYKGIVPCGLPQFGVTSLHALGIKASMDEVDVALKEEFRKIF